MKKLSTWAAANVLAARIVITFGHILLALSAMALAFILYCYDISLPYLMSICFAAGLGVLHYHYPKRGQSAGSKEQQYQLRLKMHGAALVLHTLIMIVVFNQAFISLSKDPSREKVLVTHSMGFKTAAPNTTHIEQTESGFKKEIKKYKRKIKNTLKVAKVMFRKWVGDDGATEKIL